jgi:excisionase family DNA binding protein
MIDAGELEAIRIGRLVRVRPEALQALIESK